LFFAPVQRGAKFLSIHRNLMNHLTCMMFYCETELGVQIDLPARLAGYRFLREIGAGGTSVVFEAENELTGALVAVKVIPGASLGAEDVSRIEREISVLRKLEHDHVVRLVDVVRERDLVLIVTELCAGGDAVSCTYEGNLATVDEILSVFRELLRAVAHVHAQGIAHGDIKPENVLIDGKGRAKLADFGSCQTSPVNSNDDRYGTPRYAAPELFYKRPYDTRRADIWSLGITLFSMVTGELAFPGSELVAMRRIVRRRIAWPENIDAATRGLIDRMTAFDPSTRPSAAELLRDPFFSERMNAVASKCVHHSSKCRCATDPVSAVGI